MVDQRGELVNPFSQSLLRPQLPQEGNDLPQHEERVTVEWILPRLGQGRLDMGKGRLG